MKKIFVSIINWKDPDNTLVCLDSLDKNVLRLKVILTNNGKEERITSKMVEKYKNLDIDIINNDYNTGFVEPHNQAIKLALGAEADWVLLLNNDVRMNPEFLQKMVEYAEDAGNVGLLNPVMTYFDNDKIWFAGSRIIYPLGITHHINRGVLYGEFKKKYSKPYDVVSIAGTCELISTRLVKKIGYIDKDYFAYYEDVDYSFRARKSGFKVQIIPSVTIEHKVSASANRGTKKITAFQAYLWGRNAMIFARKQLNGLTQVIFILGQIPRFVLYLGRFSNLLSMRRFWRGIFDGLRGVTKTEGIISQSE